MKCPKCKKSLIQQGPSYSTCMYFPTILKDGVNINPDRNTTTTSYECLECNHNWSENNKGNN